jgi:hypothetical protein
MDRAKSEKTINEKRGTIAILGTVSDKSKAKVLRG